MRCHAAKAVIALRLVYNFMRASSLGCMVCIFLLLCSPGAGYGEASVPNRLENSTVRDTRKGASGSRRGPGGGGREAQCSSWASLATQRLHRT